MYTIDESQSPKGASTSKKGAVEQSMYTIDESQSPKGASTSAGASAKKHGKIDHEITGQISMMDLGDVEDLSDEDAILDA